MIVLTILKWIGIVLLILLGLVLLLLALVLFVPIRYRVKGKFEQDIPDGRVRVGWLLGLLRFALDYHQAPDKEVPDKDASDTDAAEGSGGGQELRMSLKVLWITLWDNREEEAPTETTVTEAPPPAPADVQPPAIREEKPMEAAQPETTAEAKPEPKPEPEQTEEPKPEPETAHKEEPKPKEEPKSFLDRIEDKIVELYERVRDAWKRTAKRVGKLCQMIRRKTDGVGKILEMVQSEQNKDAVDLFKRMLLRLLKELLPRKGQGRLILGTGDPYSTGIAMEAAALLYPLYHKHFEVVPDFENSIHDVRGEVSGAIRLAVVAWTVLRVIASKKLRKIYHRSKRIIDEEILS